MNAIIDLIAKVIEILKVAIAFAVGKKMERLEAENKALEEENAIKKQQLEAASQPLPDPAAVHQLMHDGKL